MKTVSSILMGGLGNYMFQIAATYAYARKHNMNFGFNCSESSGPHKHITEYQTNIFKNINLYYVRKEDFFTYNEKNFHYNEIPYYDRNILLYGYFQSEKYFSEYREDIINLFMSYEVLLDEDLKKIIEDKNTCSIHVRRGDYFKYPNHHPVQSINYYMRAVRQMPKDFVFLIFSDDISWCKENFPDIPEKFIFIENKKDYEDLYIMSKCKNNIICNSTFSWWGAWLNKNNNKKVIVPNTWFGNAYSDKDIKDLYCSGWIKI